MSSTRSNLELAKLEQAKAFLADTLLGCPVEATEVVVRARANGISNATLRRAKYVLSVRSRRIGGSWVWTLPETQDAQRAHQRGQEVHQEANQGTHRATQDKRDVLEAKEKRMPMPRKRLGESRMFAYSEVDGGMIPYEELRARKGYPVEAQPEHSRAVGYSRPRSIPQKRACACVLVLGSSGNRKTRT